MTTITPRPKSKMVELGEVIRSHREFRKLDLRTAADMCACSIKLFEDYERGEAVPDGHRWAKLTHIMNRALTQYRPLWQEALNEEAERSRVKPLTVKPFAALTIVPKVQEKLQQDMEAQFGKKLADEPAIAALPPLPEEPKEEAPKLFFNVSNLPEGWRQPERVAEREEYARQLVRERQGITAVEIREAQKAKFGVATAQKRIAEVMQDELDKMKKQERKAQRQKEAREARAADPYAHQRSQERKAAKAPKSEAELVAEAVSAATELLLESIPNLSSFTLTVDEHGQATVAYKTRKVVVQEDAGTITVGVKK